MGLIHLDNNYLAKLHDLISIERQHVSSWIMDGAQIGTCAISWTEFLRGPKDILLSKQQIDLTRQMLSAGITPFGETESERAARLFNLVGRPKRTNDKQRMDCLIATCAILSDAELATMNTDDFKIFLPHGLRLATSS